MFGKKNNKDKTSQSNNEDEKTKDIKEELEKFHNSISYDEILKTIDSSKDLPNKKDKKLLNKVYDYWVYIIDKNGEKINDFGVKKQEVKGVDLLVRTEKIGGETKVVFRELLPESKCDLSVIYRNKKKIKEELDKLLQIEQELENEEFEKGELKEYNYDLADVKLKILEKRLQLDSIRFGAEADYIHKWLRDDGIPAIIYQLHNGSFRVLKRNREVPIFSTASESKQIENIETKNEINEQLKRSDERDWKKIIMGFFWVFLLIGATYGTFELLNYNYERANGEVLKELDKVNLDCQRTYNTISNKLIEQDKPLIEALEKQTEAINKLFESNLPVTQDNKKVITK